MFSARHSERTGAVSSPSLGLVDAVRHGAGADNAAIGAR